MNVNRTAWWQGPSRWTPVVPDADLSAGEHRNVDADGVPILLHRAGGRVWALANTCSHMGGSLDEGIIADGCVTCPWHGSTFRFVDGGITRGPASTPQPSYDTRVSNGRIEVRAPR